MSQSNTSPEGPVPHPVSCDPERSPDLRRFDCRHYNACLDHALDAGWQSFGCHQCRAYSPPVPEAPDPGELARLVVPLVRR